MKYLILCLVAMSTLNGAEPEKKIVQIANVKAQQFDGKQVWVKGKIIEKRTDDDFLLQDESDEITLFLTTDALIDMHLQVGMNVEVLGTIDYSAVSRTKTELDADKVIIKR